MITVHVEFQEGWNGESVVVQIDGKTRFEAEPVTRMQTGFATSAELDVEPGRRHLTVRLPGTSTSGETRFDAAAELWIGVTQTPNGEVELREQETPFGYI